jgi:hypothetical protein
MLASDRESRGSGTQFRDSRGQTKALARRRPPASLRAKVIEAESLVARETAVVVIGANPGHEALGLGLSTRIENGEASDHLDVREMVGRSEELLDARGRFRGLTAPIEQRDVNAKAGSAAGLTLRMSEDERKVGVDRLRSEIKLVGQTAGRRSSRGSNSGIGGERDVQGRLSLRRRTAQGINNPDD